MSATAAPKRPRTARQLRADQGVVDVRIVGYDPRLADGTGDAGGSFPPPEEPPARRRNGYGGGGEVNWKATVMLLALLVVAVGVCIMLDARKPREAD